MLIRVSDVLRAGGLRIQPAWKNFEDVIAGLVDQLASANRLPASLAAAAVQAVRERETMASTAMVNIGVSIPHARLDGLSSVVAAMAVSPVAVYQVADGLPISIVTLVLSSPAQTGEHLNFLATLSLLLQSARTRDRLRTAGSAAEVLRIVRAAEQRHG